MPHLNLGWILSFWKRLWNTARIANRVCVCACVCASSHALIWDVCESTKRPQRSRGQQLLPNNQSMTVYQQRLPSQKHTQRHTKTALCSPICCHGYRIQEGREGAVFSLNCKYWIMRKARKGAACRAAFLPERSKYLDNLFISIHRYRKSGASFITREVQHKKIKIKRFSRSSKWPYSLISLSAFISQEGCMQKKKTSFLHFMFNS